MLARLVRNRLLLGIGAGAVLILGSATAVLAQTGPSPGVSPSDTDASDSPSTAQLAVALARTSKTAIHSGTDVGMTATVSATGGTFTDVLLAVSTDNKDTVVTAKCVTVSDADRRCRLGTLTDGQKVNVEVHVIPKGIPFGTVTVNAEATSGDAKADAKPFPLKVTESASPSPKGSTGTTTPGTSGTTGGGGTKKRRSSGGTTTGSGRTGGSTGSTTGSGGTTGNVPLPTSTLSPPTTGGVTPPTTAPSPGAVLPSIGAQPPSTAGSPPVLRAGNSQSMRGKAEGPDELTFNKLASTQAAWLAALLVAFSLLLTQVRLGRAANWANRPAGVRRRLRPPRAR